MANRSPRTPAQIKPNLTAPRLLALIQKLPCTRLLMSERLGIPVRTVAHSLKQLREKGLVIAEGNTRHKIYRIAQ